MTGAQKTISNPLGMSIGREMEKEMLKVDSIATIHEYSDGDDNHSKILRDLCCMVIETVKGSPEDLLRISDMLRKEAMDDVNQALNLTIQELSQ